MMSFSDYQEGSKTAEYQGYVNKAYDLADKVAEARPEEAERVYKLAERYSRKMAENMNDSSRIGMMCPSVMISGAGNFPVKKNYSGAHNPGIQSSHRSPALSVPLSGPLSTPYPAVPHYLFLHPSF